jgi:hypothetical protein
VAVFVVCTYLLISSLKTARTLEEASPSATTVTFVGYASLISTEARAIMLLPWCATSSGVSQMATSTPVKPVLRRTSFHSSSVSNGLVRRVSSSPVTNEQYESKRKLGKLAHPPSWQNTKQHSHTRLFPRQLGQDERATSLQELSHVSHGAFHILGGV